MWRVIKKAWVVETAVALLLATAVAILALYGVYLERESGSMSSRIGSFDSTGYILATEADPMLNPDMSTKPGMSNTYDFLVGWYEDTVPSNIGSLSVAYVDYAFGSKPPRAGEVAIHRNVAQAFGLSNGDYISLYPQGRELRFTVGDIFTNTGFDSGIDIGEGILVHTGEVQKNTHFLYKRTPGYLNMSDSAVVATIAGNWHSRADARVELASTANSLGKLLVRSSFAVLSQARFTLMAFLCLAFLTAKLLSFMDNRKMVAILKALGLKRLEVAFSLAKGAMIAPLLGTLLGALLSIAVLSLLKSMGHDLVVTPAIRLKAMVAVVPAVSLGLLVPARMAQVGTVNELLFERPVALFREKVSTLRQVQPGLEPLVSQGVHFVKIEKVDGVFDGFIFRQLGDTVQAGEVMALDCGWWGMKVKEYVAPVTGTVVYYEEETGVIGVGPTEMLTKAKELMTSYSPLLVPSNN